MYDPALGRFIQPDSIIPDPGSAKGCDRYSYVNNNPINYNDPSGHCIGPLFAVCIAAGAFIVENASVITSIVIVGALTSFLTADTPQQELVNNPEASQALLTNDMLLAGAWLTAGQFTLDVGAYYAEKGQHPTANNPVASKPKAPYAPVENSPTAAPDFVVTANGEVIIVPENAVGPYAADDGLGFKYENGSGGHGLNPSVTGVRIMDPTVKTQSSPGYPGGYVILQSTGSS